MAPTGGGLSKLAAFFAERARGGAGLMVTGGIAPNRAGTVYPMAAKLTNSRGVRLARDCARDNFCSTYPGFVAFVHAVCSVTLTVVRNIGRQRPAAKRAAVRNWKGACAVVLEYYTPIHQT